MGGFGYHRDCAGAEHANEVGSLLDRAGPSAGHDPATLVAMAQVRATMAPYDALLDLASELQMTRQILGDR